MDEDIWQDRLRAILEAPDRAAAVRAEVAVVEGHLRRLEEIATGADETPAALEVTDVVLGADACAGGWVGVLLEPGAPRPRVLLASSLDALVEMVRESVEPAVVALTTEHPEVRPLRMHHPRLRVTTTQAAPFAAVEELEAAGLARPSVLAGRGYDEGDVLAACAAAVDALRGSSRGSSQRPVAEGSPVLAR